MCVVMQKVTGEYRLWIRQNGWHFNDDADPRHYVCISLFLPLIRATNFLSLSSPLSLSLPMVKTTKTRDPNEKLPSVNTIRSIYSEMIRCHINIATSIYYYLYTIIFGGGQLMNTYFESERERESCFYHPKNRKDSNIWYFMCSKKKTEKHIPLSTLYTLYRWGKWWCYGEQEEAKHDTAFTEFQICKRVANVKVENHTILCSVENIHTHFLHNFHKWQPVTAGT